jgi:hypothetical protein
VEQVEAPGEQVEAPGYRRGSGRSLLDFLADVPPPPPSVEPIGFAHNGFHTDDEQRFQPLSRFEISKEPPPHPELEQQKPDVLSPDYPLDFGSHAHHESPDGVGFEPRHELTDDEPRSNGRHSRAEPGDTSSRRGRHSRPGE